MTKRTPSQARRPSPSEIKKLKSQLTAAKKQLKAEKAAFAQRLSRS